LAQVGARSELALLALFAGLAMTCVLPSGDTMASGRLHTLPLGPGAGAEGYLHPVGPRRDRAAETTRPPVPPVPRAPRAKPKANPRGTLANESRKNAPHVEICDRSATPPAQVSERRRPREESPFAHARKHALSRHYDDPENQQFQFGPTRKTSADRGEGDFRRGQGNAQAQARAGSCPPLAVLGGCDDGASEAYINENGEVGEKRHARRRTLQRERAAAGQALEWVPESAAPCQPDTHARRNVLDNENAILRAGSFSRIMGRNASTPPPQGEDSAVVSEAAGHGRRNVLAKERDGSVAHEGQTFARILGR